MPITVSADNARRVAIYRIRGALSGPEFVESMTAALRSNPAIADYDHICDITDYTGDVDTDDVASVAMLTNDFRTAANRLARTALVTHDRGFSTWAQVMSHQFERRQFGVFGTREAAEAWLEDRPQAREAA